MLTESQTPEGRVEARSDRAAGWPLSRLLGLSAVVVGLGIGLSALDDNSFFTHLVTGRGILDGDFPREDTYTFTGAGRSWVAQSWLASTVYGALDAAGGAVAIRLFTGLLTAGLAGLVWRSSRAASSALVRGGAVAVALVIGSSLWTERPLLIGLVLFAVVMLVVDEGRSPKVLVPVMWVWVNVHGSFPLALVLLGCLLVGGRLDRRPVGREVDALKWAAVGVLAGGIVNPYGPRMLLFPVELLSRSDILRHVVEWQSPVFDGLATRAFLVLVSAAVFAVARRPSYQATVPLVVFVVAALVSARNINLAVLVLVPIVAAGLGELGGLRADRRSTPIRLACVALVALMPLVTVTRLADDDYDLERYPASAFDWLERRDLLDTGTRVAAPDFVGNWLELRYDTELPVFIDDRYELHDRALIDDYLTLIGGGEGWEEVLDRWRIDRVVWRQDRPLVQLLETDGSWSVVFDDDGWSIACRADGC